MGWKKINVDVTRRRGGSMPPRMGSAQRAPAWKATLREALCVFFVVGRVVLRTEQKHAASAPDHQHDECETEEQIELRLLQFERYRDEAQGDRRQDRQRMPIPGLGVEAIEQEDGDCHFVLPRYNAGSWPTRMGCSLFAAENVIRRHARDGAPWPPCRGSTACLRARQSG